jgi:hypothetical protein
MISLFILSFDKVGQFGDCGISTEFHCVIFYCMAGCASSLIVVFLLKALCNVRLAEGGQFTDCSIFY